MRSLISFGARARKVIVGGALVAALSACGAAAAPLCTKTVPPAATDREAAIDALGRTLFAALRDGEPERALLDDLALRSVLDGIGASRANAIRQTTGPELRAGRRALTLALRGTTYVGVCLQRSSVEAPGGALGLRTDAWVVERALIVAQHPRAGSLAGWVEGSFVFTSRGFGAVAIDRVEPPRPAHSDLEMAACDMAAGLDLR